MNGDRPTRARTSGRVFLDLRKLARTSGQSAEEILRLYALEGLLARLVISRSADFTLKGDILLAAYGIRHPAARKIDIQPAQPYADALAVIQEAAGLDIDDGLYFGAESATAREVRGDDERKAVRAEVPFELNTVRATLRADIAADGPVPPATVPPATVPKPRVVTVPGLLGRDIVVSGYPLALMYAEKIVTVIDQGPATMGWRDFADIYALSGLHPAHGGELAAAIRHEADRREVALRPLADVLGAWVGQPRPGWMVWRRKQRLDDVPLQFPEVLDGVIAFADPVLLGRAAGAAWRPGQRLWVAHDGACSGVADDACHSVRGRADAPPSLGVRPAAPSPHDAEDTQRVRKITVSDL